MGGGGGGVTVEKCHFKTSPHTELYYDYSILITAEKLSTNCSAESSGVLTGEGETNCSPNLKMMNSKCLMYTFTGGLCLILEKVWRFRGPAARGGNTHFACV